MTADTEQGPGVGSIDDAADPVAVDDYVRGDARAVEAALVARDPATLPAPDRVVGRVFGDAFMVHNTDFDSLEEFLDVAGAGSVWALSGWLDWVLDWHVLGNTRFWSWEWLVHAAVGVRVEAARAGPIRCVDCGAVPEPTTGSIVETPGRAETAWIAFVCPECSASGRAERHRLAGDVTLGDGLVRPDAP